MRYFMYGAPSRLPSKVYSNNNQRFEDTGHNTGNLFIGYAIRKQIDIENELIIGSPIDPDKINSEYDAVVISASNFINSYSDWTNVYGMLSKLKIPIITIGIGMQLDTNCKSLTVSDGSLRFLKMLSDRSKTIGVRGSRTAEYLNSLGIKNSEIIGCPTCFVSCREDFKVEHKVFSAGCKYAINWDRKPELFPLLDLAIRDDADIIMQSELTEMMWADINFVPHQNENRFSGIISFYKNGGFDLDKTIRPYFKQRAKMFFDIKQWGAYLRQYSFIVGPRMHGNMIALQNGVNSVWIAHDQRTSELVESLNLPTISFSRLEQIETISQIYDEIDYSLFNKKYPLLYANYVNFLDRNGVRHNLSSQNNNLESSQSNSSASEVADIKNAVKLEWTGERYLPETTGTGAIQLEHVHRYTLACEFAKAKSVLDIACGEGYGSAMLAKYADNVVGVDVSVDAIAHARKKYENHNLKFKIGSCAQVPLPDKSVDLVVSFETIEHHDQHHEMMREIKRVLKPGGMLLISSPDKHEFSEVSGNCNIYHIKELYEDEFKSLIKTYFRNSVFLGQRVIFGSGIFPCAEQGTFLTYNLNKLDSQSDQFRCSGVERPMYFLTLASDSVLPPAIGSILEKPIYETEFFKELLKARALLAEVKDKGVDSTEINAKNRQIAAYKEELYLVYTSFSWRFTWPLRKVGSWCRHVLRVLHRPGIRASIKRIYFLLPSGVRNSRFVEKIKNAFLFKL